MLHAHPPTALHILIPYQPSILPTFFHPYTPHPSSPSPLVPSSSLTQTQTRTQNKKHNLQLPIQPRLKPLLTPHRPTNHGYNNELTSRLSTHRHWRIDGDAHGEGGGEGGKACWRHIGIRNTQGRRGKMRKGGRNKRYVRDLGRWCVKDVRIGYKEVARW
jgi:hypothetical protein